MGSTIAYGKKTVDSLRLLPSIYAFLRLTPLVKPLLMKGKRKAKIASQSSVVFHFQAS